MSDSLKSVLITGAGGFLGAWVAERLLSAGVAVTAFDLAEDRTRLAALVGAERAAAVPWTIGDITDPAALDAPLAQSGCGAILHLAALTIPACRETPVRGALVDVIGHINVLEATLRHGVERVVYTSSIAAHPRGPLDSPANLYGVYKRAAEDISKVYFLDHGLASVGLRPNIVYGFGRDEGETAAVTAALRAAALGEAYELPFGGRCCLQYAGEVAEIVARCLAVTPEQPVVSDLTTEIQSIDGLVTAIRRQVPEARITVAPRERPAPELAFDNTPLRRLIGDWRRVPLEEGVRLTIEAYRKAAAPASA